MSHLPPNQLPLASGNVNVNSNKLTGVTDPTSAQDAGTKAYADGLPVFSDFGDGSDGAITLDAAGTGSPKAGGRLTWNGVAAKWEQTGDIFCTSLTTTGNLDMGGYRAFGTGRWTNSAIVSNDGRNGALGGAGGSAGSLAGGGAGGAAGADGAGGGAGGATTASNGGAGGAGGAGDGGAGGAAGAATALTQAQGTARVPPTLTTGVALGASGANAIQGGSGGGGGGGGVAGGAATLGGAGGGGGGCVWACFREIDNTGGTIRANGGNGSNGGNNGAADNGGGGGGGGGGCVHLVYETLVAAGTIQANGGTKGLKGAGGGGASADGVDGSAGTVRQIAI